MFRHLQSCGTTIGQRQIGTELDNDAVSLVQHQIGQRHIGQRQIGQHQIGQRQIGPTQMGQRQIGTDWTTTDWDRFGRHLRLQTRRFCANAQIIIRTTSFDRGGRPTCLQGLAHGCA